MKIAILCLPRYEHLKQLILRQLASLEHSFWVFEEGAREFIDGGFDRLEYPSNVEPVVVARLDEAAVSEHVQREGIDQVISFSDRGVVLAARLRERFGMGGNSVRTEACVVDKGRTRKRLVEAGLSRVLHRVTSLDRLEEDARDFALPVVVKPTSLGASFCVQLVEDRAQLPPYIERCRANRVFADDDPLIIEQYLPGPELSLEGIVSRGEVTIFGVTESHTSGPPYFVGTGHDFFPRHEDGERLGAFVTDVIRCLGMTDCPFHIELKVQEGLEVIEAHTRYGGAMIMELVEHATELPVFSTFVQTLAGTPPPPPRADLHGVFAQHLLGTPAGVIERIHLAPEVTADPRVISHALDFADGDTIEKDVVPLQYAGYVTFRAEDREDALRFRAFIDEHFSIELRR